MTLAEKSQEKYLAHHHRLMLEKDSSISSGMVAARGYWTARTVKDLEDLGFKNVKPEQLPSLVVPLYGVDGDVVYHQHRPDCPRVDNDGRTVKYESLPNQPPRIDVGPIPFGIDDPSIPLWITEGVKKVDSAIVRGICCVGLIGVWNWRGKSASGGLMELADWDRIAIKGRIIYIAYDSDVMVKPSVKQALKRLAAILRRRGAKDVRPVVMPHFADGKTGLDDWFATGKTASDLLQHVDLNLLRAQGIVTNNRSLADVTSDALEALIDNNIPPTIFVRGGELCRVRSDERSIVKIEGFSPASMRGNLARCATWVVVRKESVEIAPPKEVVEDLLALPEWPGIPPIIAITMAPVLSPNGTLSMAPGYDPASMFYIGAKETWPTWTDTTAEAVRFLTEDMLGDFPFKSDADRAHAIALMLLPIMRPIIDGPTPLHLIEAPVQGSGKSLLGKVCLMPTVGDKVSATTGTKDEEEWRKKIASSLLEGKAYIFLDNLSRKVDSDTLAGVLTSTEWNDRALSTMRNINVPVRCLWVATANNAELSRDILRRTVLIRLDACVERPEDRTGFRHENLEVWVRDNRPKIVSALCKLVQSWVEAGMPPSTDRLLGSFEEWSKAVGGVLKVAGVNGYLGNIEELRIAASPDDEAWASFYLRWYNHSESRAVKAGDLIDEFRQDETLAGMLGDKDEASKKTRLGLLIRKRIGIIANGFRIEHRPKEEIQGSKAYRLVKCDGIVSKLSTPSTPSDFGQTPSGNLPGNSGSNDPFTEGVEGVEGVISSTVPCAQARALAHTESVLQNPLTPSLNLNPPLNPLTNPLGNGENHQNSDENTDGELLI